jgi:hypothetical protein
MHPGTPGFTELSNPTPARSDGVVNFDLSIFREFPFGEAKFVEFRAELFNAFNTPACNLPNGNFSSTNFGAVTSTLGAIPERQVQLGLKIIF